MKALNSEPTAADPKDESPISSKYKPGRRPAWVEAILRLSEEVEDENLPTDMAERHDHYALGDLDRS